MENYWKRFSVISFLALILCGYLLYHHTEVTGGFRQERSFCSINATFDCDSVAQSAYSVFLGVPVAGWGLVYYLYFLVLLWLLSREQPQSDAVRGRRRGNILLFFSFLSLIPSIWLLAVSHFLIGKYCLVCCALDVANILLFLLACFAPGREGNFLFRLTHGAREFASVLGDFSGQGVSPALSLIVTLLAGLTAALVVPDVLARHYFEPRRESYVNEDLLRPFLEAWKKEPGQSISINPNALPMEKDFSLGNPNASVKIIEFSDFECPYCKRTAQYLKPFLLSHSEDFYFVFKNYPIDKSCNSRITAPKHLYACRAAVTARCAGMQSDELFWKTHDAIMNASLIDENSLSRLAGDARVHEGALGTCLGDPLVLSRVQQDVDLGNALGIVSTPTIFVNGRKVQIAPPYLPGFLSLVLAETKRTASKK